MQFVRKISGFQKPSKANEKAFNDAVKEVASVSRKLLKSMVTEAAPHNREIETRRAHERALLRFKQFKK